MAEPKPLVTSAESQALRDALSEARASLGAERDVDRLRAKLGALPPVAAGPGGAASASVAAKAATIAIAGALVIGAAFAYVRRAPERAERATMQRSVATSPPVAAPAPAPSPTPAPAIDPPTTIEQPAVSKVARVKAAGARQPEPAAAPAPPGELELLMAAQDALEASPQRALGLLEQHARLHPSGNFALEREALAIDALRKLGRVTDARQRARGFVARFPNAPSTKRLQRWLDESAATDHKEATQPLPTR